MIQGLALKDFFVSCLNIFFLVQTSLDNSTIHDAVRSDNLYKIKFFLTQGCDVNAKDDIEGAPLHSAACRGYLDIVKLLIENGANPNEKNGFGFTPLHWAARKNYPDVAVFLISKGVKINEVNRGFQTPIRMAAKFDNIDVFKVLVENGADMNEEDKRGFRLFDFAADEGSTNIVKFFIKKGFDVNAKNKFGKTPLFYSIAKAFCNEKTIQCLLENGARVDDEIISFCSYPSILRKCLRVVKGFDDVEDKFSYAVKYAEQDSEFFSTFFKRIVFCRSAIDIFKKNKKINETTYYKFFMREREGSKKDYKSLIADLKENIKQVNLDCISQTDISRVLCGFHFHENLFEKCKSKLADVVVFCEN